MGYPDFCIQMDTKTRIDLKGNVTDKSIKRQTAVGGLSNFKCSSV
jgi:hypothetical protein